MKLLKSYISKNKTMYFISIFFAIVGVIFELLTYILLAKIVTFLVQGNSDLSVYKEYTLYIFLMFVFKEVSMGISTATSHTAAFNSLKDIREKISNKLFRMCLGDILNAKSGKLKNIIVDQVDHMETTLAHIIPEVTANVIGPLLLFVYMLIIDFRLALLSLIPLFIGVLAMKSVINKRYKINYEKSVEISQNMNNAIIEYISGVKVIKAFNQGNNSYKKYKDAVYDNANFFYNWMKESMMKVSVGRLISPMGLITILPFGLLFYMQGSLNITDFITIIILSFGTINGILKVMNYTDDIARISTIVGEIESILDAKELNNSESWVNLKSKDIEFKNVEFSYKESLNIIDNMSFKIKENQVVAFVGESGSGKSTITKLIAGFWNSDKGKIEIGGININEIPLNQLSGLISYVSQDNFLFDISIKENIKIANKEATDEEIVEIAKKSGCHDFIMKLQDGYDTLVGDGGSHLSGGERQRITIARAMLKDSPIIILDEATSYLDPENENIVQEAISNLVKGKTLIMIAHRLKTVTGADKIFLVEKGKISAFGTHNELLEKSDTYKNMWDAVIKGGESYA